jgi:hypothetical protein
MKNQALFICIIALVLSSLVAGQPGTGFVSIGPLPPKLYAGEASEPGYASEWIAVKLTYTPSFVNPRSATRTVPFTITNFSPSIATQGSLQFQTSTTTWASSVTLNLDVSLTDDADGNTVTVAWFQIRALAPSFQPANVGAGTTVNVGIVGLSVSSTPNWSTLAGGTSLAVVPRPINIQAVDFSGDPQLGTAVTPASAIGLGYTVIPSRQGPIFQI